MNVRGSGIYKMYGNEEALRNLDITLDEDTIYGLLGRNGAGKTTFLNIVAGGIFYDDGQITFGDVRLKQGSIPEDFCLVREENLFFSGASVMEILKIASAFYPKWDWEFARELLEAFNLNPGKKVRQLSRGMQSLLGNTIGLASRAKLTVFDEPMLGLDVVMREKFYHILKEDHLSHPRTILISTHLIDEIAVVAEQIFILENGRILLHDNIRNIEGNSFSVTGKSDIVREFAEGRKVIYERSADDGIMAVLFDSITEDDREDAIRSGLEIQGVTLQKMFSYIIGEGKKIG